jgi:hypothetical protein
MNNLNNLNNPLTHWFGLAQELPVRPVTSISYTTNLWFLLYLLHAHHTCISCFCRTSPNGDGLEVDAEAGGYGWMSRGRKIAWLLECVVHVHGKSVHFKHRIDHLWFEFSAYHSISDEDERMFIQATLESVFFEDLDSSKRTLQPAIRSWVSKAKPRRSQSLWKFGVLSAFLLVRIL